MDKSVRECEHEVEVARAKLARDLATLSDPSTITSFTTTLKDAALEKKDEMVDQVKDAAQSHLNSFIEGLKAKAAANPVATLSIGAGLAWHFLRNPPIATALIGAGLYSLLRTNGAVTH